MRRNCFIASLVTIAAGLFYAAAVVLLPVVDAELMLWFSGGVIALGVAGLFITYERSRSGLYVDEMMIDLLLPEVLRQQHQSQQQMQEDIDGVAEALHGLVDMTKCSLNRQSTCGAVGADFVTGLSHELRTPLSSISAYAELLLDGEVSDEKMLAECYRVIHDDAQRLRSLIDMLVAITSLENDLYEINRDQISVKQLFDELKESTSALFDRFKIDLVVEHEDAEAVIVCDKLMLICVFEHLLDNAVKHSNEASQVIIRSGYEVDGESIVFSIEDEGEGIPDVSLPHVFDKFYKVGDNTKGYTSAGLGLNLVKSIVEKIHNGQVEVTSELGSGTTFTVRLPICGVVSEI